MADKLAQPPGASLRSKGSLGVIAPRDLLMSKQRPEWPEKCPKMSHKKQGLNFTAVGFRDILYLPPSFTPLS